MRALMLLTLIVIASVGLCQQTLRIAVYQGDDKFSRSYEIGRYLDFYEIPYSKIGPIDEVSISPYDLIIIDDRSLSNTEVKKLKEFVKNGGVLIAIGAPSSLDANGNPRNGLALDILGLKGSALQNSITTREVVITKKDLITEGVYGDSFQVYSPTYNLYPANANLSEVASFRFYTYPAIATNRYGKGLVIWYQFNPFYQYLVTHRQEMNLLALNSLRKASNFKEKPLAYLGLWPDGAKSAVLVRVDFNGEEVKDEFLKINRLLAKNRKKATLFIPFYTIMDGDIKNDLMLWQNIGYEISCYGLTQDPWKDVPFSWKERRYGKRSFFSWVTSYRMPSKYPMGPFYLVYEQEFWKDLGLALHSLYSVGVSPKGCVIPYSGSIGTFSVLESRTSAGGRTSPPSTRTEYWVHTHFPNKSWEFTAPWGLNQTEIAGKIGVPSSSIVSYESENLTYESYQERHKPKYSKTYYSYEEKLFLRKFTRDFDFDYLTSSSKTDTMPFYLYGPLFIPQTIDKDSYAFSNYRAEKGVEFLNNQIDDKYEKSGVISLWLTTEGSGKYPWKLNSILNHLKTKPYVWDATYYELYNWWKHRENIDIVHSHIENNTLQIVVTAQDYINGATIEVEMPPTTNFIEEVGGAKTYRLEYGDNERKLILVSDLTKGRNTITVKYH